MASAGSMSSQEIALAECLIDAGVERTEAVLAVVMYTRGHARPELEIVDLVRQYSGLPGVGVAESALAALRRRGWVVENQNLDNVIIFMAALDFPEKVANLLKDPSLKVLIEGQRRLNQPSVQVLGQMHDPVVYRSFGPKIRTATNSILLPMINTTPRLAQVVDMRAAANSGVSVRVLLATPKLAAKIRGNTSLLESKSRIQGWMQNAKGIDNFEIRLTARASDLWLASSMCIDGHLVRIDVFDPISQRTTQGVMVEVNSGGLNNLAMVFEKVFDEAWRRCRRPGVFGVLGWLARKVWLPTLAGVIFVITTLSADSGSVEVAFTGGVVAGLVSNYLPKAPQLVSEVMSRIRR